MLGLGNSLNTSSLIPEIVSLAAPSGTILYNVPDDEAVLLSMQFNSAHPNSSNIENLFNIGSVSYGGNTNVSASVTFERYDDSAGTTLQATSSGTVYAYVGAGGSSVGILFSHIDQASFLGTDFLFEDGAALINLSTFGGTDITSSNNGYYKAVLEFDFGPYYDPYVVETAISLLIE